MLGKLKWLQDLANSIVDVRYYIQDFLEGRSTAAVQRGDGQQHSSSPKKEWTHTRRIEDSIETSSPSPRLCEEITFNADKI